MNCLVINYDPFAKESQVTYILNNKIQEVEYFESELTRFAEVITDMATNLDVSSILVHMPDAMFNELEDRVQTIEGSKYAVNKIKLELL